MVLPLQTAIVIVSVPLLFLLEGCGVPSPTISNRRVTSCLIAGPANKTEELFTDVPDVIRIREARISAHGTATTIMLVMDGTFSRAPGRGTIEVYFDSPSEKTVHSRALIATFGGHTQLGLDETDPAGVFVRTLKDEDFDFERVGTATLIASGKKVRLEGDLGIADATPNLIVLRYASEEVFQKRPDFRFTSDGIATVVYFRGDEIHSRPLPRLPNR